MYDTTIDDYVSKFTEIQEQLKSRYETYCNHCDGEPLSYDVWQHSGISYEKVWDDNKQAFVQEMFDDLPF